jgi:hypothetical protein
VLTVKLGDRIACVNGWWSSFRVAALSETRLKQKSSLAAG